MLPYIHKLYEKQKKHKKHKKYKKHKKHKKTRKNKQTFDPIGSDVSISFHLLFGAVF